MLGSGNFAEKKDVPRSQKRESITNREWLRVLPYCTNSAAFWAISLPTTPPPPTSDNGGQEGDTIEWESVGLSILRFLRDKPKYLSSSRRSPLILPSTTLLQVNAQHHSDHFEHFLLLLYGRIGTLSSLLLLPYRLLSTL